MPPRKKPKSSSTSSGSKKAIAATNQPSQPSKFGIQHFFERHTQNTILASQTRSSPGNAGDSLQQNPKPPLKNLQTCGDSTSRFSSLDQNPRNDLGSVGVNPSYSASGVQNPSNNHGSLLQNPDSALNLATLGASNGASASRIPGNGSKAGSNDNSQQTPSENLFTVGMSAEEELAEASPEISKSISLKRFKFSPGMLIRQSQDDGGEEVTWRISPVNDRLQAVSKRMPKVMKVLAESSRLNSLSIQKCSQTKNELTSPGTAGKVEKWLSSPTKKASERSLSAKRAGLKRENICHDDDLCASTSDINGSLAIGPSPFRTPPSLSYCHGELANNGSFGASNIPGFRQHKKALLELLDQVEDAISIEDSPTYGTEAPPIKVHDRCDDIPPKVDPGVKSGGTEQPEEVTRTLCYFLVLEVSEKRGSLDSGAQSPYKVLRLLNEQSGEERAVYLWEEWFYSVIAPGDSVNVIGEFDDEGKCDVDRENNFLVVHPDILLAGTRVAASFSCPRRTVLDERLKCSEYSSAALIGTLLHQVFQAGLLKDIPTRNFLEEYARVVLQKNLESIYACGANDTDIHKTLVDAIPRLLDWIMLFRDSQVSNSPTIGFGSNDGSKRVKISKVIDIEEMAWAPKYGLKGMIDASVRVNVESNKNGARETIMPLEFKTGKAPNGQSSTEHCAQVILYTLLMSERYLKHIDSGLLYYLQSNQTQGIMVKRSDLVGLIMRRNELANDILKASTTQQLPPMLQSPSMCRGCRHLDACTVYHKAHGGTTESSGLGDIFDTKVHHLSTSHFDFLRHWDRLIDLEAKDMQLLKRAIWHSNNVKSLHSTSCLSSVVLDTSDDLLRQKSQKEDKFIYRFVHKDLPATNRKSCDEDSSTVPSSLSNTLDCTLRNGDYVVLSTVLGHLTHASGIITDIGRSHVSVSFSKRLRLPGSNPASETQDLLQQVWRIDKDGFLTSFSVMRFNLVQLFLQSTQSSRLRKMIVDLEAPRFDSGCIFSQDPAISYIWSEKSLNDDQRRAILKILTAKDYALVLGMPGTGKTSTMVHAVKALLIRGASILLTSYTNSAVDNLLIKLKSQGIDFLRIGRHEAMHEEIQGHSFSAMNVHSVEDIKTKLDQAKVVAVTCLGITSPLLINKRFDVCIMDEAGQTTLPVSLGPLMLASMFVLVGDHYQLPPLVQSTEARENGMGISMFCRLSEAHPQAISALQSQYRMCQGIMELSNALIYGDRLRCGSPEIADAKLKLSTPKSPCSFWLKEALNPSRPVIFINTDLLPAYEARDQKTVSNPFEAHLIAEITERLIENGIESKDIGIITPYNAQANLIQQSVSTTSVEIHTIDKYQGRDKDCILLSFVRSSENPRNGAASLLGDWHRINVALTRAKKKLIMVGSCRTLSKVPLLKILIDKVEEQSGILSVSKKDIKNTGELKRCSRLQ